MNSVPFAKKTLLLGVGVAKAGTSWLYDYFRQHPEVLMSPIKELHYWNMRFRPDCCPDWNRKFASDLVRLAHDVTPQSPPGLYDQLEATVDRLRMNASEQAYMRFFRKRVQPHHLVFGEFTPGYCLIPEDGLRRLRAQHSKVQIILLLRDPVGRFYSSLRMQERQNSICALDVFMAELKDNQARVERCRYDLIIERLERVFGPDELHIEFFETLFTNEAITRICRFVGVSERAGHFSRKVNASPPGLPLPASLFEAARHVLAPSYDYCRQRFGARVPATWH